MPLVAVIKHGAWRVSGQVLKSDEYEKLREARELLDTAQEEADAVLERASAAYEAEKRRGYQDGQLEAKAVLAKMQAEQVGRARSWVDGMERQLGALVARAVERIIGEMDDAELLAKVVRRALEDFQGLPDLRLRVAPEQVEPLQRALEERVRRNAAAPLRIEPDPALGPEECVLESALGVVDLSLPRQLDVLRQALTDDDAEGTGGTTGAESATGGTGAATGTESATGGTGATTGAESVTGGTGATTGAESAARGTGTTTGTESATGASTGETRANPEGTKDLPEKDPLAVRFE